MSNYVYNGARCMCQTCPTAIGELKDRNKIDGENKKGIIDIRCDPSMKGKCNMPSNPAIVAAAATGNLPECVPVWVSLWMNTEPCKVKLLGNNTRPLLSTAIRICAYGGVAKIISPSCFKTIHQAVPKVDFSSAVKMVNTQKKQKKMDQNAANEALRSITNIYSESQIDMSGASNTSLPDDFVGDDEDAEAVKKATYVAGISDEKKKELLVQNLYSPATSSLCKNRCSADTKSKCEYAVGVPTHSVTLKSPSNGQTLKANMNNDDAAGLSNYDKKTLEAVDRLNNEKTPFDDKVTYHVEYHHLVPGNECFSKYPNLVTLANLYGYNINNPKNGIPLPSYSVKAPMTDEEKEALGKYIMKKTKRQLHRGQHKYNFDPSELEQGAAMMNDYETSIDMYLSALNDRYQGILSEGCFKEKTEEQMKNDAENFKKDMDLLCDKVRKKVQVFSNDPQSKDAFYVSKAAALYK